MPQDSGTEETRSAQDLKETSRGHLVSLPFICLVLVFYLFIYFLSCHKSLLFDSRERTWAALAWRKVEMVLPEPPVPQRFTVWKWQEEPAVGRG